MLIEVYGTVTKTDLKNMGVKVMDRFNNANFKAKRSGCSHMFNFVVYGGSKRGDCYE